MTTTRMEIFPRSIFYIQLPKSADQIILRNSLLTIAHVRKVVTFISNTKTYFQVQTGSKRISSLFKSFILEAEIDWIFCDATFKTKEVIHQFEKFEDSYQSYTTFLLLNGFSYGSLVIDAVTYQDTDWLIYLLNNAKTIQMIQIIKSKHPDLYFNTEDVETIIAKNKARSGIIIKEIKEDITKVSASDSIKKRKATKQVDAL